MTNLREPRQKWLTFAAVSIGTFQTCAIISMVSVSLPTLVKALGTDLSSVQWVVIAYSITMAGLLLTFGRLGDLFGRRKIYTAGFLVFGVGAGLCSISNSLPVLVASRVLQAFGGAMLVSNSTAIITAAFPSAERGRALGFNSAVVSVATLSGGTVAGLLIDNLGWRAVFQVHVALALIGAVAALAVLPRAEDQNQDQVTFDFAGAALLLMSLVSLTIGLNQGRRIGWGTPTIIGLFAFFAVSAILFVIVESRHPQPVLNLRLLKNRAFAIGNAGTFIMSLGNTGMNLALPFFAQDVLGFSATVLGLLTMIRSSLNSVLAPVSGWLGDRFGPRPLTALGLALGALALLLVATLGPDATFGDLVPRLLLLSIGLGIFQTPNNLMIMGSVPRDRYGTASGFMGTMRHLGTTISLAAIGAVFSDRTAHYASLRLAQDPTGLAGGFRDAVLLQAGLYFLGSILCLAQARGKLVVNTD